MQNVPRHAVLQSRLAVKTTPTKPLLSAARCRGALNTSSASFFHFIGNASARPGVVTGKRWQHSDAQASDSYRGERIDRDFILSILQAQPSARDSRSYLKAFGADHHKKRESAAKTAGPSASEEDVPAPVPVSAAIDESREISATPVASTPMRTELVEALLNPITRHTAVVKVQGPFTERQLASIASGLVYLARLGLVSIVVCDEEAWTTAGHIGSSASSLRKEMRGMANALAEAIEGQGGRAISLVNDMFRLLPNGSIEAGTLKGLKAAIGRGEIPVIPPVAYDGHLSAVALQANDAVKALVTALAEEGQSGNVEGSDIDLTPLRMMIINREGGIPSPARGGNPHLSINLESEFEYINETFIWDKSHPTSLGNLDLLRACLAILPRESSAVLVSHRSPKALIANLINNKPAHSPSLHHSLLPARHIQHTPTIVRKGLPIRVIRKVNELDKARLTGLMEASFRKTLKSEEYYARLERDLDFVIVAGNRDDPQQDYQAAAIVTRERDVQDTSSAPITYLDKFAVLPSLQGDGTVDFLWTALRDETFGLGLLDALNPNGGKEGIGFGTDLVWRSRADNPVNRWYFERSNGFVNIPEMGKGGTPGTMFWADAEDRIIRQLEGENERRSVSIVMQEEEGRLARWARVIGAIRSCWQ